MMRTNESRQSLFVNCVSDILERGPSDVSVGVLNSVFPFSAYISYINQTRNYRRAISIDDPNIRHDIESQFVRINRTFEALQEQERRCENSDDVNVRLHCVRRVFVLSSRLMSQIGHLRIAVLSMLPYQGGSNHRERPRPINYQNQSLISSSIDSLLFKQIENLLCAQGGAFDVFLSAATIASIYDYFTKCNTPEDFMYWFLNAMSHICKSEHVKLIKKFLFKVENQSSLFDRIHGLKPMVTLFKRFFAIGTFFFVADKVNFKDLSSSFMRNFIGHVDGVEFKDLGAYIFETTNMVVSGMARVFSTGNWKDFFTSPYAAQAEMFEKIKTYHKLMILGDASELIGSVIPERSEIEILSDISKLKIKLKAMMSDIKPVAILRAYRSDLLMLSAIELDFITFIGKKSNRARPFCIGLYGPTGVGKTALIDTLASPILKSMGYDPDGTSRTNINPSSKYHDTATGREKIVVIDEIGQTKVDFLQETETKILFDLVSNAPFYWISAALEEKGNKTCNAPLVFATTNDEFFGGVAQVNELTAYMRRFDVVIELKVKPEYALNNMLAPKVENLNNKDLWLMNLYRYVPYSRGPDQKQVPVKEIIMSGVTMVEALPILVKIASRHHSFQKALLPKLNATGSDLCSHGLYSSVCKDCLSDVPVENQSFITEVFPAYMEKFDKVWLSFPGTFRCEQYIVNRLPDLRMTILRHTDTAKTVFFLVLLTHIAVLTYIGWSLTLSGLGKHMVVFAIVAMLAMILEMFAMVQAYWKVPRKIENVVQNSFKSHHVRRILQLTCLTSVVTLLYVFYKKRDKKLENQGTQISKLEEKHDWKMASLGWLPTSPHLVGGGNPTQRPEHALNHFEKHLLKCTFSSTQHTEVSSCLAFRVRSNVFLTVAHPKYLMEFNVIELSMDPSGTPLNITKAALHSKMCYHLPNTDLLIFILDKVPPSTDNLHYFADDFAGGNVHLIRRDLDTSTIDREVVMGEVPSKLRTQYYKVHNEPDRYNTFKSINYTSSKTTQVGWCGSLMVTANERPAIVGFHVAGLLNYGLCCAIKKSAILEAMEVLEGLHWTNQSTPVHCFRPLPVGPLDLDENPHHSVHHLDEVNSLVYMGSSGVPIPRFKSELSVTPFSASLVEKFGIKTFRPAISKPAWQHFHKACVVIGDKPVSGFPLHVLDKAVDDFCSTIKMKIPAEAWSRLRVLSKDEVVNGFTRDVYKGVKSIDPKKSAGIEIFGIGGKKGKYMQFDEFGKREVTEEIWDIIDALERDVITKDERLLFAFKASAKDEPREEVDGVLKAPRTFFAGNMVGLMMQKKMLGMLTTIIAEHPLVFETAFGVNAYGPAWGEFYSHLSGFSVDRAIAGDYGKFDLSMFVQIMIAAVELVMRLVKQSGKMNEDEMKILKYVLFEIVYPVFEGNGHYLCGSFGPSGHWWTFIFNGLVNSLLFRCVFFTANPDYVGLFSDVVRLITGGDDNEATVADDFQGDFGMITLHRELSKVGMKYTDEHKMIPDSQFVPLRDTTFLKRGFSLYQGEGHLAFEPLGGYVVKAPLDKSSVLRPLCVTSHPVILGGDNSPASLAIWAQEICMVLAEASLHDKSFYHDVVEVTRDIAIGLGILDWIPGKNFSPYEDRQIRYLDTLVDGNLEIIYEGQSDFIEYENQARVFERVRELPSAVFDKMIDIGQNWHLMNKYHWKVRDLRKENRDAVMNTLAHQVVPHLVDKVGSDATISVISHLDTYCNFSTPQIEGTLKKAQRLSMLGNNIARLGVYCDEKYRSWLRRTDRRGGFVACYWGHIVGLFLYIIIITSYVKPVGGFIVPTAAWELRQQIIPEISLDLRRELQGAGEKPAALYESVINTTNTPTHTELIRSLCLNNWITENTKKQNLEMMDHNPSGVVNDVGATDATRSLGEQDLPLSEFFERPIVAASYVVPMGTDFTATLNPAQVFFDNKRNINRLNNYYLMSFKLRVKFLVNGSPFHYGRILVDYQPLPDYDNCTDVTTSTMGYYGILATQRMHGFIDPGTCEGLEMSLPFVWPYDSMSVVASDYEDLGLLRVRTLNQLKHANGATTPINLTCMVWAEDVSLQRITTVPSSSLVNQSVTSSRPVIQVPSDLPSIDLASPKAGRDVIVNCTCCGFKPAKYGRKGSVVETLPYANQSSTEYRNSPVSGPASAVASVAKALSSSPVIGPYARATEMGAATVSKISRLLGYSKPANLKPDTKMMINFTERMAICDGESQAVKLSVDSQQELTIDPRVVGVNVGDEMTIASIAERESYICSFPWTVAKSYGDILWNTYVNPSLGAYNGTYRFSPACEAATIPFSYWRGEMCFRFEVVCSRQHRGRLLIVYDPNYVKSLETNVITSFIVDLDAESDIVVKVPWSQAKSYLNNPMLDPTPSLASSYGTTAIPLADTSTSNGVLAVYVLTELAAPSSIANNDLQVNVYAKLCDASVAVPNANCYDISYVNQSAVGTREGIEKDVDVCEVCDGDCEDDNLNLVYFGEKITSFRSLLKRFSLSYVNSHLFTPLVSATKPLQYSVAVRPVFPPYRGAMPSNAQCLHTIGVAGERNITNTSILNYLTPMFLTMRGGLRLQLVLSSKTSNVELTQFIAFRNGNRTTPVISANAVDSATYLASAYPDTSFQASLTATQKRFFPGGGEITLPARPVLILEFPFYRDSRFLAAKDVQAKTNLGPTNLANSNSDSSAYRSYVEAVVSATSNVFAIEEVYVSTAEDFQLDWFQGMPPWTLF